MQWTVICRTFGTKICNADYDDLSVLFCNLEKKKKKL